MRKLLYLLMLIVFACALVFIGDVHAGNVKAGISKVSVSFTDEYESDDSAGKANVINPNDPDEQLHNFHAKGDQDWVMFYGIEDEPYAIQTYDLGANCNTVIRIYDTDRTTLLVERNDKSDGGEELLSWSCPADGTYFVQIIQYDSSVYGDDTEYSLIIFRPIGPFPGYITGTVSDTASGQPIAVVQFKTEINTTALSLPTGNYLMVCPEGKYILTAAKPGYITVSVPVTCTEAGTTIQDIVMSPVIPPPTNFVVIINVNTVEFMWDAVDKADGYKLYYAPPDISYIGNIDIGNQTIISVDLWSGAAFYVAVQSYNSAGSSDYSNIEYFIIP